MSPEEIDKAEVECVLDESRTYVGVDGVLAGFSLGAAVTVIQMETRTPFVDAVLVCSVMSAWCFVVALLIHLYTYEAALGSNTYFRFVPRSNQGALVGSLRRYSSYGEATLLLGVAVFAVVLVAAGFVHSFFLGVTVGPVGVLALLGSFIAFRRTGLGGSASYHRALRR